MEILSPAMKHRQEADVRAQVFGIRRNRQQRLRHRLERNGIDPPRILKR